MDDLVRADAGVTSLFDRRLDDVRVGHIQIQNALRIRLEIGLFPKAHNDKTATHNSLSIRSSSGAITQSMIVYQLQHHCEPERAALQPGTSTFADGRVRVSVRTNIPGARP